MFDKVILHIGLHKTGTTSLQKYFGSNRSGLQELGILYPKLYIDDFSPNNHSWPIINLVSKTPSEYHLNIANNLHGLKLEAVIKSLGEQVLALKTAKEKVLLISGEGISTLKAEELAILKNKLLAISSSQVTLEVHYFTRQTKGFITSIIQQRLKGGTRESIILKELAKSSLINIKMTKFYDAFENAEIINHDYGEACSYNGGLETYFSEQILKHKKGLNINDHRVNEGLSNKAFQLIRYYIEHSKKYTRVPVIGSLYSDNIIKLAAIKGEKYALTLEQHSKLQELTQNNLTFSEFLNEFNFTVSETDCWLNTDLSGVESVLDNTDHECQQVLVNFFRDMALNVQGISIASAYNLMKLAHKYRPNGPLINRKIEEYLIKMK
ncbi:MAG: hypothetical protein GY739_11280 [Mesoflavibacter sp.]|nr:hypothetical protein [Mesoflavibacter sp.]